MDIFLKFAKGFLVLLLAAVMVTLVLDIGKVSLNQTKSDFVVRNANTYITTFGITSEDLLEYETGFKETSEVKDLLKSYFLTHYGSNGYTLVNEQLNISEDRFYMKFTPDYEDSDQEVIEGPVYVRALFYGFDGTPAVPSGYGNAEGIVEINIENKVPSGFKAFVQNGLVLEEDLASGFMDTDYEGFWGYYSSESEEAFKVNLVD